MQEKAMTTQRTDLYGNNMAYFHYFLAPLFTNFKKKVFKLKLNILS